MQVFIAYIVYIVQVYILYIAHIYVCIYKYKERGSNKENLKK